MKRTKRLIAVFITALILSGFCMLPVGAAEPPLLAEPSDVSILLDGEPVDVAGYMIDGANYFRLRDLAYILKDTPKEFSLEWDTPSRSIWLYPGHPYKQNGTECAPVGGAAPYTPSSYRVSLTGGATDFTGYYIGDSNYYKVRDIMAAFDVSVSWDAEARVISLDTSAPYESGAVLPPAGEALLSTEEIAARAASVVMINTYDDEGEKLGQGSGFFVRSDGWIATCFHVLDDKDIAKIEIVTDDGTIYMATTVLAMNVGSDLALIKAHGITKAVPLPLGDSGPLVRGQRVVVVGSPYAMRNTVSDGIVSGFRDDLPLRDEGRVDIQITTPISSGSSGGAMFDLYGNVIGIIYATHNWAQNANFAVPVNDLKELFEAIDPIGLEELRAVCAELEAERRLAGEIEDPEEEQESAASLPYGYIA